MTQPNHPRKFGFLFGHDLSENSDGADGIGTALQLFILGVTLSVGVVAANIGEKTTRVYRTDNVEQSRETVEQRQVRARSLVVYGFLIVCELFVIFRLMRSHPPNQPFTQFFDVATMNAFRTTFGLVILMALFVGVMIASGKSPGVEKTEVVRVSNPYIFKPYTFKDKSTGLEMWYYFTASNDQVEVKKKDDRDTIVIRFRQATDVWRNWELNSVTAYQGKVDSRMPAKKRLVYEVKSELIRDHKKQQYIGIRLKDVKVGTRLTLRGLFDRTEDSKMTPTEAAKKFNSMERAFQITP